MQIELQYGKNKVYLDLEESMINEIINPSDMTPSQNPELEIKNALKNPIEGPTIEELSPKGKSIAIAVDDLTRATPTNVLLPTLIELLRAAGARKEDIKIVIALGTHRKMTEEEIKEKYGPQIVEEYRIVNHAYDDESELKYVGKIADDIPVWINKEYLSADIRIVTGNLIPHFNAGWAGGAKILLPGLAGEETVGRMHVHSASTTPNGLGMEDNPTRLLIDDFAKKVGIHLLVNTAITRHREMVKVFAGHFIKAHRKGLELAKKIYGVKVSGATDITITSSHPADIEFWQGLKGLFSADIATKAGGEIIELTPCPEGISMAHPKWIDYLQYGTSELKQMYDAGEIEDFVALGLALNVAHIKEKHPIYLISDGISDKDAEKIGFKKFKQLQEAVDFVIDRRRPKSKVNILTYGGETYPIIG